MGYLCEKNGVLPWARGNCQTPQVHPLGPWTRAVFRPPSVLSRSCSALQGPRLCRSRWACRDQFGGWGVSAMLTKGARRGGLPFQSRM